MSGQVVSGRPHINYDEMSEDDKMYIIDVSESGLAKSKSTTIEQLRTRIWTDPETGEEVSFGSPFEFQGSFPTAPADPEVNWTYRNTGDGTVYLWDGNAWVVFSEAGSPGTSADPLAWQGELANAPADPENNWTYYNTTLGKSYVYSAADGVWYQMASDGEDGNPGAPGVSIEFLGSFASAPSSPTLNQAYRDTTNGVSYIWTGSVWDVMNVDGLPGQAGGTMNWLGELTAFPPSPSELDGFYHTIEGKAYVYQDSTWYQFASDGEDGVSPESINWLGSMSTPPANPNINDAYRDLDNGVSYIWDGDTWDVLVVDGEDGSPGAPGTPGADGQAIDMIFRHDNDQPNTPAASSGVPIGWSSDLNTLPYAPSPIWACIGERPYTGANWVWMTPVRLEGIDGDTGPQGPTGSTGAPGADGQAIDMIFRRSESQPSSPGTSSGVPSGWYSNVNSVPASSDPLYGCVGERASTGANWVWMDPVRMEGADGATPDQLADQGSSVYLAAYPAYTVISTISIPAGEWNIQFFGEASIDTDNPGSAWEVSVGAYIDGSSVSGKTDYPAALSSGYASFNYSTNQVFASETVVQVRAYWNSANTTTQEPSSYDAYGTIFATKVIS